VVSWETFLYQLEKFGSDVGDDIATIWWVEPYYVSTSRSFLFRRVGVEIELVVITAVLESFLVWFGCRIEGFFVGRYVGQPLVDSCWYIADYRRRMIALLVDIQGFVIRFGE
jgi:hypothetical protein